MKILPSRLRSKSVGSDGDARGYGLPYPRAEQFLVGMSGMLLLIVLVGFSPTLYLRGFLTFPKSLRNVCYTASSTPLGLLQFFSK